MALRVGIQSKRELYLLKELGKGSIEFENLNEKEKWIVYNSKADISGVVDKEQIRNYERQLALDGHFTRREKVSAMVSKFTENLRINNG